MKHQANDPKHFGACHKRWLKLLNRPSDSPVTPEEWVETQCMFCAYYLLLPGEFAFDWGVCSNAKSPMDGKVAFEHDGCDFFVENEDYFKDERAGR